MAAKSQADAKRKYSWWWDSHISPKNSKWLQENLTDMDSKVKHMIKLIEEDADSFARRAEMYYKKRPELMKLVEEFYRAYRALAERYDHATGVIRQAHRTMAEAFPNQVPMLMADDLPTVPFMEAEPRTPEMSHSSSAFIDPDEVQKDSSGNPSSNFHAIKRNGAFTEEPDSAKSRRGLKQLNDLFMSGAGRARKELNFHDVDNDNNNKNDGNHGTRAQVLSESERVTRAEAEILALKRALAKLEDEKEAGLLQYQQSLEKLSNLESEVSHAQDNSREINERACKAEAEVQTLKETLNRLQAEREVSLLQYQQCLEKVSKLEKNISSTEKDAGELNERVIRAESEAESLKKDLTTVEAEKEASLDQYKQCLETVSKLEDRLVQAEENARKISEQANKAGNEIEALKLEIAKLTEEKEDAALRYQQCLEIISSFEHKLFSAEEEVRRLNSKIDDNIEKLLNSEHKCLLLETSNENMQSELQSLVKKLGCQNEELSEKQQELGRLWNCIQEERLRFVEAETAFQTLQNLHSQSQEELRSIAAELHHKAELLENVEFHKQALEDEVQKVMQENKILNEFKISSSLSTKNLQDEILNLREIIEKLEHEVELRVDERNALQQEIYCLKKELSDVNKRHDAMIEEARSTGLDPQCFGLSVQQLQVENSKLKETCEADRGEKAVLLEKLQIMEKLWEKNTVLENSLSDLNVELESVRGKVQLLEETCQSLLEEKSTLTAEKATLFSQLQSITEKLENVSQKNNLLENSLFDANAELEVLKVKLENLEDSYQSLDLEKSNLISDKETLAQQLNIAHQILKSIENQHSELELKHLELKGEKESALQKVEELLVSFYAEREEHYRIVQLNERHLAEKELQLHIAQEDANWRKKEYEEELDRAAHAEIEIFLLQKCIRDLEENNFSLLVEYQRLLDKYKISEKLVSNLENENVQKQVQMDSLSDRITMLRSGLLQGLKTLDLNSDHSFDDMAEQDHILLDHMHGKIQEKQSCLDTIFNERQHLAIENSVLATFLGQLKLKAEKLVTERDSLDEELRIQSEKYKISQKLVSDLENENVQKQVQMDSLSDRITMLRSGLLQGLKTLDLNSDHSFDDTAEQDHILLDHMQGKIQERQSCLDTIFNERQHMAIENSVLATFLGQLKLKAEKLVTERDSLDEELRIQSDKYKISQKSVSNLENENVQKQVQMDSLSDRITMLRSGLLQGLKTLDLHSDHSFDDTAEQDHILLDHMQGKIQERQSCLDTIFNESQHLAIENSVLVTFLGQLKLKAEKLATERDSLDEELRIQSEQFLALQVEVRSIQEKNQELKLTIRKGEQRIEEMATKTGDLLKQLSDLELAHKNLQDESCNTLEQKKSLVRRFLDLGEEKNNLEEEICAVIHETIAQSNISLIYQNIVFEKVLALRELSVDLGELCSVNEDLKNRLKAMTEKLEDVQMENSHLKESFDRSSIELRSVQSVNDQLGCQIQKGKELLSQKENELLAAAEMFSALHTEKTELQNMLEDLRFKYDEAKVILDDQAHQILNLSSDKDCQNEDLRCLREVNQKLESEMGYLREELEETRVREEKLNYQLKEGTNEIELWETQAATLYEEVQISTAKEILIEGKFRELANTCESQNEELRCLLEVNQKLESEMGHLREEVEESRLREEKLNYQLKEGADEIELWETQAATLYEEVQISTANETLYEGKFRELANTCESQNEELRCLLEVNQKLDSEMGHLREEVEESRLREEKLNYQLKEGADEIELWETQAATLYEEVQISTANETLNEGKFRELANTCESLERVHNNKSAEGEWLKERVSKLEDQNGRLRDQLAAYVPAVSALKDCIASLEMQALVHAELHSCEKSKVNDMMNHDQHTEGGPQTSENQIAMAPDALPDIQEMQKKINAIEMAVKHLNENFKPKDELREIQELQSGISWNRENTQSSNHGTPINEAQEHHDRTIDRQKIGKSIPDIPVAGNEVLTKDIILDQMSESSSYSISRRGTPEVDDEMLELWETAHKDSSVGLTRGKVQQKATSGPVNYHQKGVTKEPKNKYPSIESLVEKELSVDKLEISKRLTQASEEDNKPKIIERLDSDAQKLANLRITVLDLVKKVETTEKSTKGKGNEYDNVKGQLEVTEESITKLFEANRKLMKNVEEGKLSFVENPEPESDESGSISRRRVSEQARRGSEKIGRLQLEVQRLQFLLLKLDEERESKGKAKMADRSPRVLLRDYLYGYGGTKSNQKKKKKHFCSCVHPPTKGD